MRRWLPSTLFGQMLLILLAGLLVSHLVGTLIYASDRAQAVRAIGGYAATQRIANLTQLIDDAPPAWRSRIVQAAGDPSLLVTLSPEPPAFAGAGADANFRDDPALSRGSIAGRAGGSVRVTVAAASAGFSDFPQHMTMRGNMMTGGAMSMGPNMTMTAPPWLQGTGGLRSLQAAVRLSDGQWLAFAAALPNAAPPAPWPFAAATATMAVIVVLASAWAVGRVTAPLRVLAKAAERLGRDVDAPPVTEAGTKEMRQAAQSFNQMQARIRRLLDNRTRMLAALSHDLRTPLTLLRLRTEALPEAEERERMLATIGGLDDMIGVSLKFARGQAVAEVGRRTDVSALLAAIVDDMADAGLPVTMAPAEPVVLECQPGALRRAVTNLIDNAVKYGGAARVAIQATASAVTIDIEDDGPGIPEAELQRVFEPFHRLEESRSRETGGSAGRSVDRVVDRAGAWGRHSPDEPAPGLHRGRLRRTARQNCAAAVKAASEVPGRRQESDRWRATRGEIAARCAGRWQS